MVEKGNERKRDQSEATAVLTQDAQDRVSPIVEAIRHRIQFKREKVEAINKQLKALELEINALDNAKATLNAKMQKREEQLHKSELLVKKQKEELRNIQRMITPELVKQLYTLLENKNIPKIVDMVEALVGLLRNSQNVTSSDVRVYLQRHEGLLYKM